MFIMKNRAYNLRPTLTFYFLFYLLFIVVNFGKKWPIYRYNLCYQIVAIDKYSSQQKLSFLSLELTADKMYSLNKEILSQEIIINGINNATMRSQLMSFLSIPLNNDTIFDLKNVHNWVNRMKFSGFFLSVEYLVHTFGQHQAIQINVKVNPILKKICISNYKNKVIPYSYILFVFRQQLGYPLNFTQINKAIELIARWYHKRGYELATVKFISQNQLDKSIAIDIVEGLIKRVEIHVEGSKNICAAGESILPRHTLLNTLNLKIDSVFNSYSIENGLKKLNQKNIIRSGSYKVNGEEDICLIIYLELKNNKVMYLSSQKIAFAHKAIEVLGALFYFPSTQISKNDILTSFVSQYITQGLLLFKNPDIALYPIMRNCDKNIAAALSSQVVYKGFKAYKFFCNNVSPISCNDFGFRYHIHNIGLHKNSLLIYASLPKSGHYCSLTYYTHVTNLLKGVQESISYKIVQESNLNSSVHYAFAKQKSELLKKIVGHHLSSEVLLLIKSNQRLNNVIYVNRELALRSTSYKYLHLYSLSNLHRLQSLVTSYKSESISPKVHKLWNYNIESFIKFQCYITFNNKAPKISFRKFSIKSVYLAPSKLATRPNTFLAHYNYSNKIMIAVDQSITVCKQKINIIGLIMKVFGDGVYLPAVEQNLLIGPSVMRGYSERFCLLPKQFSKISLEYALPITSKSLVLLFMDYARGLDYCLCKEYSSTCTNFLDTSYVPVSKHQMSYGIGFHFQAPIKQVPPLRFEYGYNIDKTSCFHIRIKKQ